MKALGVRELRQNLSGHLRDAQAGETLLVTDRGKVIAKITSANAVEPAQSPEEARWAKAIAEGFLALPTTGKVDGETLWKDATPLGLPEGTAHRLLDEQRGDR